MSNGKGILIIVEVKDGTPQPASAELFTAAKVIDSSLNKGISAVAVGTGTKAAAEKIGKFGAAKVFASETAEVLGINFAPIVASLAGQINPRFILMAESDLGSELAPLLAARLNTAAVTGVVALGADGSNVTYTRPVYGGNALADFTIETEPQVVSIRPKAFSAAATDGNHAAEIIELPNAELSSGVRVLERVALKEEGPKIEEARIVIGGGRGLGGLEGFTQLKQLADLLGGVVGASRPPCDQGWWPESGQIGITGKTITPDLYIAIGISGSSQHLSGVSGTKTLVAINKDAEANIFKAAAYGVTGDWKKVVPAFIAKVKELTGR